MTKLYVTTISSAKARDKDYKLGDGAGLYTRGEYWNERITMMQWWSDELDRLRTGAKILKPNFGGQSRP